MNIDYIIVQAGGKGTRMKQLTYNKPKALIPIDNLPMIFHLFRLFPNKKFIVIGDYKYDVLNKYLKAFAEVDYEIINARGLKGTCAGLRSSMNRIPENKPFLLIWSDLVLSKDYTFPENEGNYIGISKGFSCRWKFENGKLEEKRSREFGVAGHFIFENKRVIENVPEEGELVRWLSTQNITFVSQELFNTQEYGLLEDLDKLEASKCRPFNKMIVQDNFIIKEPIDEQGRGLAVREAAWYEKIKREQLFCIPKIYDTNPIKMERIRGRNIYEYNVSHKEKRRILEQLINCIKDIHNIEGCPADRDSFYDAYVGKTFKRLEKVQELIPFAKMPIVIVNGIECPNVFFVKEKLVNLIWKYMPGEFRLIHGDCTFSNMMLRDDGTPVMIDPRGYFGRTELYGDPAYDWVKLYYSIAGNYDQFNLKRFCLKIEENHVELNIESNHWEDMEEDFFQLLEGEVTREQMKILHAITYLSLTTYAWQDYDSVCGAFYMGLLILKEAFEISNIF